MPFGRAAISSGYGAWVMMFNLWSVIIVCWVRPCMMTDSKGGATHLLVRETVLSRSIGFLPVLVGNPPGSKCSLLIRKPFASSYEVLEACHSIGALFRLDSFITATTRLMVGVPSTTGTCQLKVVLSSTTKATWSSSYSGTPSTCTRITTYPIGWAFLPMPMRETHRPYRFILWSKASMEPTFSLCLWT